MANRRKPQSLNDSHYRFLQALTTPRPSNPSSSFDPSSIPSFHLGDEQNQVTEDKPEKNRNLRGDRDDSIPRFSVLSDSDSPLVSEGGTHEKAHMELSHPTSKVSTLALEETENIPPAKPDFSRTVDQDKQVKVKIEGRRRLCKISSRDSGNDDKTQHEKAHMEFSHPTSKVSTLVLEETTENIPPAKPDFSVDQDKQVKVKIEGRRRLCKISSRDSGNDDKTQHCDDPTSSDFADFDSPMAQKICGESNENEDTNNIRDILNSLSARFDLLSIEKKRPSKANHVDGRKSTRGEKLEDKKEVGIHYQDDSVVSSWEARNGADSVEVDEELETMRSSHVSFTEKGHYPLIEVGDHSKGYPRKNDSDAEDDDCIVLSGRNQMKELDKSRNKSEDIHNSSVIDESVDDEANPFILTGPRFTYSLPKEIAKMLYPHQREGLKWLWSLHCQQKGGILGDDMGLGKTMQICGFLAGLFHSRLIKRVLIVAPKTLLSHWIKELSAVGLSKKTKEYFGTCPKARQYELHYVLQHKGILLTTYDIVRNNSKSLKGDAYFKEYEDEDSIAWDYMILDEGHLIKNPNTQRAKSLLEIPSAHRIIISGTPIQNNLRELWSLFYFCCPELLGDKKEFKEKYEDRILCGNDKRASDREKRIGSTVAKDLRERIQPYFLRRLKSEVFREDNDSVAKLSKKNEVIVWLRLTSCQRRIYEAYLNSELVLSAFYDSPLAALTILKKICDHPLLLTKRAAEDVLEGMDSMDNPEDVHMAEKLANYIADVGEEKAFLEKHDSISCKMSFIMSLLDNLIPEGHNVLIFSQTRKMLNLIQESLVSNGYKYLRIDGTTKASDRIKIVNEFQEGTVAPVFLLTSQVGGLGLTLTKADRVIVVDPAWNPSTDNQSVDRAYRIGQKKDVIVYRLMTCGTVEEKIYRKQIYKGGLFKTATEHKEQMRYFSQQDLRELFNLPKEGFDVSPTQQQLQEEHGQQHQMDDNLKTHIEFLETLGIAGVSHHSLLYSKTTPVQVTEEEVEEIRPKGTTNVWRYPSSRASVERDVDGAAFAFNPKDVKHTALSKSQSPASSGKLTESEIRERISRLSHMLGNKVMISRLPDKGEKIQKQIVELNLELNNLIEGEPAGREVIDLDEFSSGFQKQLNVTSHQEKASASRLPF
ncbi:hypothetical protein SAY86_014493 [Trapa natans]|uniref:Protein CHROMATIN REMODELING 24 n=1 Tax=Trapa natans TaxID=22666 RepID=A0AAN7KYH3_TRANT|nr:hypothetical protein SAY86_014493 [Trapa natans]